MHSPFKAKFMDDSIAHNIIQSINLNVGMLFAF